MGQEATVAIVGAGLVGALNAIYFAQRGWKVELFELRSDMRQDIESRRGKSINLALSERGLSALRAVGLNIEKEILKASIPMKARMVHVGGKQISQEYSVHGEHINAVDRARLNEILLDFADEMDNISIYFNHRLEQIHFDSNTLDFLTKTGEKVTFNVDFIVGADGAYSRTRQQIMRSTRRLLKPVNCSFGLRRRKKYYRLYVMGITLYQHFHKDQEVFYYKVEIFENFFHPNYIFLE
ncbi:FAD/NAD(P)-binding domain-containing protein [Backusella circina FSU 941]|nr:FAD/NAD(P)-binding domain-containing protein [Backusella circina FSU 941]